MMQKTTIWVIAAILGIVVAGAISLLLYHTNPTNQTSDQIGNHPNQTSLDLAENLWSSSSEKSDQASIYWNENDYASGKITLIGALTDAEEARGYLENADIEMVTKQYALCALDGWSNLLNWMLILSDALGDYQQAMARLNYLDYDGAVTKFLDAKEFIDQAQPYFLSAKENFDSVNVDELPSELKSTVIEAQTFFASYVTFLPDFSSMTDAFVPFVRSLKSLSEGATYLERNDWYAAEIAFNDSLSQTTEAKNMFDSLRYCQTADFSTLASGAFVYLQKLESALSYYIQGCEYAKAGDTSSAASEFETGSQILNGVSWV